MGQRVFGDEVNGTSSCTFFSNSARQFLIGVNAARGRVSLQS